MNDSSATTVATVVQYQFIYYRRKVKDQNNTDDSAYSNEVEIHPYASDHGEIQFTDRTDECIVRIGTLPKEIVNKTSAYVHFYPPYFEYEKKTGINGTWVYYDGAYRPAAPTTTDTVYYRRVVYDNVCGRIPGGTNAVTVIGYNGTLPVTWLYAAAAKENNNVVVQWKVANEFNNSHFEITRSADGVSFTKIATITSKGNSSSPVSYLFTDPQPATGITLYYRIRQVDKDNKFVVSPVLQVRANRNNPIELVPNPVTTYTTLKAGSIINHVVITDLTGKVIYSSRNRNSTLLINATSFAKGVYQLKAWLKNGQEKSVKMIKQ